MSANFITLKDWVSSKTLMFYMFCTCFNCVMVSSRYTLTSFLIIHDHTCGKIYIYIYIQRKREREVLSLSLQNFNVVQTLSFGNFLEKLMDFKFSSFVTLCSPRILMSKVKCPIG